MSEKLYKTDDGSALRFFYSTAVNNGASERCARPIHDRTLMVEVLAPGSKDSIPHFELKRWINSGESEEDGTTKVSKVKENAVLLERWRRQIDAFLADRDDPDMIGTPLEAWPSIDTEQVAALKDARIYTVEALAALPDSRFDRVGPGARTLVARAKAFLDAAKGNAPIEALAARVKDLEEENARLQNLGNDDALAARVAELEEALKAKDEEVAALKLDLELSTKEETKPARTGKRTV